MKKQDSGLAKRTRYQNKDDFGTYAERRWTTLDSRRRKKEKKIDERGEVTRGTKSIVGRKGRGRKNSDDSKGDKNFGGNETW